MRTPCPYTDSVLAHFLDGDTSPRAVPPRDFPPQELPPHELGLHLEDCEACLETLQRGRRLDALLAAQAGQDMDPSRAEALLQKALVRARPQAPRTRRTLPLLAGTGLLVAGFLTAWFLLPRPQTAGTPTTLWPPRLTERREVTDAILLPDFPGRRTRTRRPAPEPIAVPRTGAQVRDLATLFEDAELSRNLAANLLTRAYLLGLPTGSLVPLAATLTDTMRLDAAHALLESNHPEALGTWVGLLVAEPDGPVLKTLLESGRKSSALRHRLRHELRELQVDLGALALATRLALPELDELLILASRRNPRLARMVAEVLAKLEERHRRVPMLLDLWTDLHVRGALEDDEDTARLLFEMQPAATTTALMEEADRTGNGPRRQRCLLALAVRKDPQSRDFLLAMVEGPRQPDAILAAYALSQLPPAVLSDVLGDVLDGVLDGGKTFPRRRRNLWLLQAAMAGARCALAQTWLPDMELTVEESQFLAAGSFNRNQFPIAAALFRERGFAGY